MLHREIAHAVPVAPAGLTCVWNFCNGIFWRISCFALSRASYFIEYKLIQANQIESK
jgi:hypothetical protein